MIIHNPSLHTNKVVERFEGNGERVRYVCTSEIDGNNSPCDVFYRLDGPHPEFGNRYFALRVGMADQVWIMNADSIETETFGMIQDSKGDFHYSSFRHHFNQIDTGAIDGGRQYVKVCGTEGSSGFPKTTYFVVKDGELIQQ